MKNKIALIGAGYWGKNLARVLNELGVLEVLCDSNKETLKEREGSYPNVKTTTDFSEIIENKEIKAVVIATPAATHYQIVKRALEAGKDVFVEKPLSLRLEEGRELVELAERKNLILMVGHILNFHPAFITLKEMISRGELGEIRYIWSTRLAFGKLRTEENVLWSFAPHDISLILDILGMPQKVSAKGKSYLGKNVPDVTLSFLEFENNKTAHIFVFWLNPFKEQKFTVIGSSQMAVYDGIENKLLTYSHEIKNHKDKNPEAIKAEPKLIEFSNKEPLMEEVKHFLECVEQRKTPKTDGKEALRVLEVLEKCEESLNN